MCHLIRLIKKRFFSHIYLNESEFDLESIHDGGKKACTIRVHQVYLHKCLYCIRNIYKFLTKIKCTNQKKEIFQHFALYYVLMKEIKNSHREENLPPKKCN